MHAVKMNRIAARVAVAVGAFVVATAPSAPGYAATTSPFDASAPHNANCSILSSPFAFEYDPLSHEATERIVSVTVRCRATGPLHLSIEAGPGASGDAGRRTMSGERGGTRLAYAMLLDGVPFGDGTGGTKRYDRDFSSTSGTVTASFYIRLLAPAGQDVPVGSYADRVPLIAHF